MPASFRSTTNPPYPRSWGPNDKILTDPLTGAPVGVQNQNANGADARFIPVDVTAAQIAAPTADMIADLDATYRLNVAPYSRYQSDGSQLVSVGAAGESQTFIPAGQNWLLYAPLTVSQGQTLVVQGSVTVITRPA